MRKLFGTDGIRGEANTHPMTSEIAMQVGRAIAFIVRDRSHGRGIVIGKDTRLSCYMLENALAAGICSMGADVMLVGPMPTPGISFITTSMRADAGVVISASHNPFQDNGIKIFAGDGFKLPDQVEAEIEDLIFSQKMEALRPVAEEVGKARRIDDAKGRYIVFLKNTFPRKFTLDDFHVVIDCAHGATYKVAPPVFEELGAKVTALSVTPDGTNINRKCGALHPELMAEAVRREGADIGLAFDGDGDRLIVCDEKGQIVDGDHVMAICAKDLLKQRKLKKKTLVATVMSNMGLEVAMESMGGSMVRTAVGDRYVVETMRDKGYCIRRRAVRPFSVSRPHHHRRRHPGRPAAALSHEKAEPAAVRAGRHHGQLPPGPEKCAHRHQAEHRRNPAFRLHPEKARGKARHHRPYPGPPVGHRTGHPGHGRRPGRSPDQRNGR